jgi:hypothetical protein
LELPAFRILGTIANGGGEGTLNSIDTSLDLGKSAAVLFSALDYLKCRYFLFAGCEVPVVPSGKTLSLWAGIWIANARRGRRKTRE